MNKVFARLYRSGSNLAVAQDSHTPALKSGGYVYKQVCSDDLLLMVEVYSWPSTKKNAVDFGGGIETTKPSHYT